MTTSDQVWRTDDVVQRYLAGVRDGIPLAGEQIRILLRLVEAAVPNVGSFGDVDCYFKAFELALFGGRNPAVPQPA